MSFAFAIAGKPADVTSYLRDLDNQPSYGDTSQRDAVRDFVLTELAEFSPGGAYVNGVSVEASGHHDAHTRNLSLTIKPIMLAEASAEPEGEG